MKIDLTKARELLKEAHAHANYGSASQAEEALYDAVAAIIDTLDPQPEQFDWSKVVPGMAFDNGNNTTYFVGKHPTNDGALVFTDGGLSETWQDGTYVNFKRSPAHDKQKP